MDKKTKIIILVFFVLLLVGLPQTLFAQGTQTTGNDWLKAIGISGGKIVPEECMGDASNCDVCDLMLVLLNISRLLFGIFGGIALIAFMWGGFGFITSGGKTEKVEANKKVIWGTITGIFIILLAWSAINIATAIFTGSLFDSKTNLVGHIFGKPWHTLELCNPKTE